MKQWLALMCVTCIFLLVWGTVLFQIFIKQEGVLRYARDLPLVHTQPLQKEVGTLRSINKVKVPIKKQTEINNQASPSLNTGLDFGAGISIDDLLESYGIVLNNS